MKYCIAREGLGLFMLCRGNPVFDEAYNFKMKKWVETDLGDIYSGDLTTVQISEEDARSVVDGSMSLKDAYKK